MHAYQSSEECVMSFTNHGCNLLRALLFISHVVLEIFDKIPSAEAFASKIFCI